MRACVSSTPLPDMALAMPTSAILHVSVRVSRQLLLLMSMCRICAPADTQSPSRMHANVCEHQLRQCADAPLVLRSRTEKDMTR